MLHALYTRYLLDFKSPAGTSRGTLHQKETWFVMIWDNAAPEIYGLGECAIFRGLSADDRPDYREKLRECCQNIHDPDFLDEMLISWPSIRFGMETALHDLKQGGTRTLYPSDFTMGLAGIPINGLIWMGTRDFVRQQIREKLNAGYRCLKLKIGALLLDEELSLLKSIREEFSPADLEIRLDANGAFSKQNVDSALDKFSTFTIHSMEQPIKAGNPELMRDVCRTSPIPIALDEELIGINAVNEKQELLDLIQPSYIILKPAFTGGFTGAHEWIHEAETRNIGWWITSALESNIGLNAIAQWTYSLNSSMTQGLGTGSLYTNNISSPLHIKNQELYIDSQARWDFSNIRFDER